MLVKRDSDPLTRVVKDSLARLDMLHTETTTFAMSRSTGLNDSAR